MIDSNAAYASTQGPTISPGDGGPATDAKLKTPIGVAVDQYGNIYIADRLGCCIRKVDTNGIITTVAGDGTKGYAGDGGPATSAELTGPDSVAVDASGNLYIADTFNNRIRKVDTNGIITTVAGDGTKGYFGDGGPATGAELNMPNNIAVDSSGNLYIADMRNRCIRKVDTRGIITTVVGCTAGPGDNSVIGTTLISPTDVAVDASGNLYIVDAGRILKVDGKGNATTVLAPQPSLPNINGVAVDSSGNLYFSCSGNTVRKLDTNGVITTVAGNGYTTNSGSGGYSGDGGPATSAELNFPGCVAVDSSGNLYIVDGLNSRIRKVDTRGIITTVAGCGTGDLNLISFLVGHDYYSVSGEIYDMDVSPYILNGRVLVPVRYLADALGAQVAWDTTSQKTTISKGSTALSISIGSNTLAINGVPSQMDTTAINTNSRVYLPARYVAEALGFNVYWLANIHAVIVSPYAMPIQDSDGSQALPEQGSGTAQAEPVTMPSNPKTGLHLILALDASSQNDATPLKIQQVIDILKNRAEGLGAVSPVVQQQSDGSISVDLPGLQDPAIANLIIKPSNLEIKNEAGDTVLSNADLEDAQAQLTPNTNQPELEFTFDQNLLQKVTAANVGRVLPIYIDGILITSPVVKEVISDGTAAISSSSMTLQDAQQEACLLRSGVLPLSLNVISVTTSTY